MRKIKLLTLLAAVVCAASMEAAPAVAVNGKLPGAFTVNAGGDKVYFSQGNLQYQGSTSTWRFAGDQYDFIGNAAGNTTAAADRATQTAWIDLFGWGTSGWDNGNRVAYQPYNISGSSSDYRVAAERSSSETLTGDYANADWGVYNAISNGGNQAGLWRVLSLSEWTYLYNTRTTGNTVNGTNNARYTEAMILTDGSGTQYLTYNIHGLILFPDNFNGSASYDGVTWGTINAGSAWSTTCTTAGWAALEAAGCVFLPAAGIRSNAPAVDYVNSEYKGVYWSSNVESKYNGIGIGFFSGNTGLHSGGRNQGWAVRLVSVTAPPINVEGNSDIAVVADFDEVTYTGSPVAPGITVTYQSTALTEGTDYDITYEGVTPTSYGPSTTAPTNAGSYKVVLTFKGGFAGTLESAFTINKADASLSETPAAIDGLQYTGAAQTLISGGTASGGTMQYSLDGSSWSEELPTASAVGSYTVWYKVVGDGNHNNIDPASFTVTISKPTMVITAKEDPKNPGVFYSTFFYSLFSYTLPAGVEAYAAELSTDALNLTPVASAGDVIPANNAFILKADNNSITLIPSDEAGIDMSGIANCLQGVDAETSIASAVTGTCYVLSGTNEDGVGFFLYQAPNQLKAHKAFVDKPGGLSSAPKRLRFVFNATTGVESIQNSAISSQKVLRDGQLIIIRNGVEYNAAGQMVK